MAPASTTIMATVPAHQAGAGSAVNDTIRELGGAVGVAVVGSVAAARYRHGSPRAPAHHAPAAVVHVADRLGRRGRRHGRPVGGTSGAALVAAAHSAFTSAMATGMRVAAGVALAGAVLCFLALPRRRSTARAVDRRARLGGRPGPGHARRRDPGPRPDHRPRRPGAARRVVQWPPDSQALPRAGGVCGGHVIEARGLTKHYGTRRPSTTCPSTCAQVRSPGFLGPERLGQVDHHAHDHGPRPARRRAGHGQRPRYRQLPWPLREVGALLEAKAIHPGRSAYQPPAVPGPDQRHPPAPGGRGAGPGRPRERGQQAGRQVLAGHGPAPGHRRRPAGRPRRPPLRRADQRARPRGHPLGAHPARATWPPRAGPCSSPAT